MLLQVHLLIYQPYYTSLKTLNFHSAFLFGDHVDTLVKNPTTLEMWSLIGASQQGHLVSLLPPMDT